MKQETSQYAFSGTGPGPRTSDGSSVDMYRCMPYLGELDDIEPLLKKHSDALELGCGTGRLCAYMRDLGLRVTGVDESSEMLAALPKGVEGIQAAIETLELGRYWSAVLLPSYLINHPDAEVRRHFVTTARRHVSPDGRFYVKRHSPEFLANIQPGRTSTSNGRTTTVELVSREGRFVTMTVCHSLANQSWTQSFTTCALEAEEIESLLTEEGFYRFQWLGLEHTWVVAEPFGA